ncbi:hypothetical protein BOSE62_70793 [Bosea sp. 62]|nr:hypothetical protein BOSE7B_50635 [Bosea sp. 7B]CAD5298614.1 hypothetical protein BOSE21B_90858 [Bosea sp. 21B]CAD5298777.1 hypothetical protein BOSE46_80932 [Bosea sp. 46]VVT61504.1 hypothetical protein BOS5A_230781 [Bosea sp. EC-HK365B]VXB12645.1 hypothetical protein BOSE127_100306 [Bosea sp. 127]VXB30938.1 hypothetical protein BOSE125_130456 [Bosea sp. 125]VXC81526.1 hypothetical protein BOSE62_70793 [Bosea sp. 62]VXC85194.1 hypothetical protein BOSE29B_80817 [Bosea sp. 29B]
MKQLFHINHCNRYVSFIALPC